MSTQQPSEEELRAAYEAEIKRLRVEDVLVQTLVSLINLGGRKAGLAPGADDEHDPDQLRLAIEGSRALLPLVEQDLGPDAGQVRDALSQLQLAYARGSAGAPAGAAGAATESQPGGAAAAPGGSAGEHGADPGGRGPAQSSGRLWVPGQ